MDRRTVKVVVTGPVNSGKTTFVGSISDIPPVLTDKASSEKATATTVAMDFGRIDFSDGFSLLLYGTPGQPRFSFMWDILAKGMIGYVLLVEGNGPQGPKRAMEVLEAFRRIGGEPRIVGVTKVEGRPRSSYEHIVRSELAIRETTPIVPCDARRRQDVKNALVTLLEETINGPMPG